MVRLARRFAADRDGGAMIETLIVINILVFVVAGFIEFGVAMNQWNQAAKAVQVGARLAAVSDPVDTRLDAWDGLDSADPGEPVADTFDTLCEGSSPSCTGSGLTGSINSTLAGARMARLYSGSDDSCDASGTVMGMCDVFPNPNFTADNIQVRYAFTGLGYAGRPGGAVPTITVSLNNVTFDFLLLGSLLGLDNIELPSFSTTIVGEDLSSTFD